IASDLFSYPMSEADLMRRAVSKKKQKELIKHKAIFIERGPQNGISEEVAEAIFKDIEFFANYGFNKSHAADYAMITVQTAFLKCHYPAEYMAALLSVYRENAEKVSTFLEECGRLEIPIMPPSVNHSHFDFDIQNLDNGARGIRFGMAAIKNASTGAVQRIIDEREESGLFSDLTDFCQRVDLRQIGKRTMEALIKVGALDQFANSRNQLLSAIDQMVSYSGDHHHAKDIGQISMFGAAETGLVDEIRLPSAEPIPHRQKLNWEKELLGFYVTDHPVDEIRRQIDTTYVSTSSQLSQLEEFEGEKPASMIGLISNIREITTRNGDQMAIIALEDRFGTIECVMFPRTWEGSKHIARENQGKVVLVTGKADNRKGSVQIIANKVTTAFPMYVRDEGSPAPINTAPANGYGNGSNGHHNGSTDMEEPPPIDFSGYAGPGDVTEPEDEYQPVAEPPPTAVQTPVYDTDTESDIDWETQLDGDPHINGEKVTEKLRYRITVYLQVTDDDEVNVRRLRRVHNQFMQFKGDDEFQILFETPEGVYRMEFKDQSTLACDELWQAVTKIVGEQNLTYEEIERKP
ncbi:MAG: OB-fold nucleic acid binding domain-containing protein, partial [Chloroflexota bacterium]